MVKSIVFVYIQKLMADRVNLQKRRDTFKKMMQQLSSKYEGLKAQLNENETFTQVCHLLNQMGHVIVALITYAKLHS